MSIPISSNDAKKFYTLSKLHNQDYGAYIHIEGSRLYVDLADDGFYIRALINESNSANNDNSNGIIVDELDNIATVIKSFHRNDVATIDIRNGQLVFNADPVFSMSGLNKDYDVLTFPTNPEYYTAIDLNKFLSAAKSVVYASDKDHPTLSSIHIVSDADRISFCCVDGVRLAYSEIASLDDNVTEIEVLAPARLLKIISGFLDIYKNSTAKVFVLDDKLYVLSDHLSISMDCVSNEFPNYAPLLNFEGFEMNIKPFEKRIAPAVVSDRVRIKTIDNARLHVNNSGDDGYDYMYEWHIADLPDFNFKFDSKLLKSIITAARRSGCSKIGLQYAGAPHISFFVEDEHEKIYHLLFPILEDDV